MDCWAATWFDGDDETLFILAASGSVAVPCLTPYLFGAASLLGDSASSGVWYVQARQR